jgi:hypothetical protein
MSGEKVHLFNLQRRTSAATPAPRQSKTAGPANSSSPLMPRPKPSRRQARPMRPGELDDDLGDL